MRISTSWNQQLGVNAILEQQSKLSKTQLQISSGKRIMTPADDPAASVRLIDLDQVTKQTEQYQDNIVMARQRLSLEEANLDDVVNVLNRIKTLTVQGLNDTYSQVDRAAIASELDQLNENLLGLANTKNANGEYIFAGYSTDTKPYQEGPAFNPNIFPIIDPAAVPPMHLHVEDIASYPYYGDQNQRQLQIGPTRMVTDGNYGEEIFGVSDVTSADADQSSLTYSDPLTDDTKVPKNLFEIVGKLAALMRADVPAGTVEQTANNEQLRALDVGLNDIDRALEKVVRVQTTIGARLNALDNQENTNADYILDMQTMSSDVGDLDFAEAISRFNIQNISLQAAQQAFSKVQNLSLFDYL
jgi:flagellar hook-associated protein 3 FlgL